MESIQIEIEEIKDYYEKKEKMYYSHFFSFKQTLPFLILLLIGLFLLFNGIFEQYDLKREVYKNGKENVTLINFSVSLGIGLGLVIFSILKNFELWKSKKNYKSLTKLKRNKIENQVSHLKFEITKENVFLKSNLTERRISWLYFDFFKTDGNFLSLYSYHYSNDLPELLLPLESLTEEEKKILTEYLKNRFMKETYGVN